MKHNTTTSAEMQMDGSTFDTLARQGAQQILQLAMAAEVEGYLQRQGKVGGTGTAVRNGHAPARDLITGIGPVQIRQPRVDDRLEREAGREGFASALIPKYARRAASLDVAIPTLYLAGVSTKDMARALEGLVGHQAANLSASVIQRLTVTWQAEFKDWSQRSLAGEEYVYFWADAIHTQVRLEESNACLLVLMGVKKGGKKGLVAVMDGFSESTTSWKELLLDLRRRGLTTPPALAIGDGALGFWAALREVYPETREQRCWVHKIRNVLTYLPKKLHGRSKAQLHEIMLSKSRKDAKAALQVFVEAHRAAYPKAAECLLKDEKTLLAFYDFPAEHWQSLRTTNPIESLFATVRLRTNKTRGMATRATTLAMAFKLCLKAEGGWKRLRGFELLPSVAAGEVYEDGIKKAA